MSDKHSVINLHDRIRRRIVVECVIETKEPLHIGIGKEAASVSEVDIPIMTNASNVPIIPGSSIKGAIKAHVLRLLSSLDASILQATFDTAEVRASDDKIDDFQKSVSIDEKMKIFNKSFGLVDKLFGTSGYASPLRLTDAVLVGETSLVERTHVRIDNDLDRAVESGLFDIQAVPENRRFKFKMIFDELDNSAMRSATKVFYKLLLKSFGSGLEIFLGGMRSRGYGLSVIKVEQVLPYTPQELALGEAPKVYTDVTEFIKESLREE